MTQKKEKKRFDENQKLAGMRYFTAKEVLKEIVKAKKEERERITKTVEKWMKTSNPAYAQDLFASINNKDHE